MLDGMKTIPEYSVLIRSKSLTYLDVIVNDVVGETSPPSTKIDRNDSVAFNSLLRLLFLRFSMPPLTDYNSNLDLDHKILLWQSCAGPYPSHRQRQLQLRFYTWLSLYVPGGTEAEHVP